MTQKNPPIANVKNKGSVFSPGMKIYSFFFFFYPPGGTSVISLPQRALKRSPPAKGEKQ